MPPPPAPCETLISGGGIDDHGVILTPPVVNDRTERKLLFAPSSKDVIVGLDIHR